MHLITATATTTKKKSKTWGANRSMIVLSFDKSNKNEQMMINVRTRMKVWRFFVLYSVCNSASDHSREE